MTAWQAVLGLFLILFGVHVLGVALPGLVLAIVAFVAAVCVLIGK